VKRPGVSVVVVHVGTMVVLLTTRRTGSLDAGSKHSSISPLSRTEIFQRSRSYTNMEVAVYHERLNYSPQSGCGRGGLISWAGPLPHPASSAISA